MKKISYKLMALLLAALLPATFVGCSDDNDDTPIGEVPEFVLDSESVKVKIGAGNKVTVGIEEGGGEYNAFILNDQIAKAEMKDGVIQIEGLANGKTSLVVSDKHSRYRRVPVMVYTTDKLELSHTAFDMLISDYTSSQMLNVKQGNDEYKVTSDNPDIEVSVTEAGEIILTAVVKEEPFSGNVTVTDGLGLTATVVVTVKAGTKPFVPEELKVLMMDSGTRFFVGRSNTYDTYYELINETTAEGKQRYGWNYYDYDYFFIDFAGDKEVGKKTDACLTYQTWYAPALDAQPIDLEIIKNDGTHIWAIYSYINKDGKFDYGHFCTGL